MHKVGDDVVIDGRVWTIAEFGTDSEGWNCARLEWRDVPQDMQKRYDVPPSMIVRDLAALKISKAA